MTHKFASTARAVLSTLVGLAVLFLAALLGAAPLGRGSEADIDPWTSPRLREDDGLVMSAPGRNPIAALGDERRQTLVTIALRWIQGSGGAGLEGLIALQIPLERMAGSRSVAPPPLDGVSFEPPGWAPAQTETVPSEAAEPQRLLPTLRGLAEKTRSDPYGLAPTEVAPPAFTPELARACVRAGWRAAGLANDDRLDGIASRARTSGALPELRLRMARTTDESGRLTYLDEDTARYLTSGSATYWFEGRLTFRLDRIVFADEELSVERIRIDRSEARSRIAVKVIKALSEWQRAVVARTQEGASLEERMAAMIAELEALATLDVLTDGWFSAQVLPPASK